MINFFDAYEHLPSYELKCPEPQRIYGRNQELGGVNFISIIELTTTVFCHDCLTSTWNKISAILMIFKAFFLLLLLVYRR